MVVFNYSSRELTTKVVYYGPGLCGKTTNLQFIYDSMPPGVKGKMLSLATKSDRTLFFDFLPIDLGEIGGMKTKVQLYTVPGQVFYNETRRLVLKGADGVVFVADSQEDMMDANKDSFRNLEENLQGHGLELASMPHVLQYNKRDLPNALDVDKLNEALNTYNVPFYEAVATQGIGVQETLRHITKLVLVHLNERYGDKRRKSRSATVAEEVDAAAGAPQATPVDAGPEQQPSPPPAEPSPEPEAPPEAPAASAPPEEHGFALADEPAPPPQAHEPPPEPPPEEAQLAMPSAPEPEPAAEEPAAAAPRQHEPAAQAPPPEPPDEEPLAMPSAPEPAQEEPVPEEPFREEEPLAMPAEPEPGPPPEPAWPEWAAPEPDAASREPAQPVASAEPEPAWAGEALDEPAMAPEDPWAAAPASPAPEPVTFDSDDILGVTESLSEASVAVAVEEEAPEEVFRVAPAVQDAVGIGSTQQIERSELDRALGGSSSGWAGVRTDAHAMQVGAGDPLFAEPGVEPTRLKPGAPQEILVPLELEVAGEIHRYRLVLKLQLGQ
jgi:signal recognition particle receptor subunit beta